MVDIDFVDDTSDDDTDSTQDSTQPRSGALTRMWQQLFPLDSADSCPECGAFLDREFVRDPATQDHWRGVEAAVCPDCEHVERL